jgi:hypothetical protein
MDFATRAIHFGKSFPLNYHRLGVQVITIIFRRNYSNSETVL